MNKFVKVKPSKGSPAVEVYRVRSMKPTRWAYHGMVNHKGHKMQQRLGYNRNKVVEVAFVPVKKKHNSIRARCFDCGSSLCVVNRRYWCPSCKGYTVQSQLNDKPRMNKLPR